MKDKPADSLMRCFCSLQFWQVHRYWPDFVNPRRFSEKLWSCMLFNRDPLLTLILDKLRVRDYVTIKVGSDCLVPLLWTGDRPKEIPFDELPSKFVIKANHGCKYNLIVKDKTKLDKIKATLQLRKWLRENFCQDKSLGTEWGYKNIKPCVIIESFIEENGTPPLDYKFYCFSGHVEILTLHFNRFEDHEIKAFNRNFEPYKFRSDFKQYTGEFPRPPNFNAMVRLAETLAAGLDFIRVDLFNVENKIYFSELTPYPGGVSKLRGFDVASLDYFLGEKWKKK